MEIEIALGMFYSQGDERRFFQGLEDNPAIKTVEGAGVNLILSIDPRVLSKERLQDIFSLLWRYQIPLAPFHVLTEKKRFSWLDDKKAYWYKSLTDTKTRTRPRIYTNELRKSSLTRSSTPTRNRAGQRSR